MQSHTSDQALWKLREPQFELNSQYIHIETTGSQKLILEFTQDEVVSDDLIKEKIESKIHVPVADQKLEKMGAGFVLDFSIQYKQAHEQKRRENEKLHTFFLLPEGGELIEVIFSEAEYQSPDFFQLFQKRVFVECGIYEDCQLLWLADKQIKNRELLSSLEQKQVGHLEEKKMIVLSVNKELQHKKFMEDKATLHNDNYKECLCRYWRDHGDRENSRRGENTFYINFSKKEWCSNKNPDDLLLLFKKRLFLKTYIPFVCPVMAGEIEITNDSLLRDYKEGDGPFAEWCGVGRFYGDGEHYDSRCKWFIKQTCLDETKKPAVNEKTEDVKTEAVKIEKSKEDTTSNSQPNSKASSALITHSSFKALEKKSTENQPAALKRRDSCLIQ